MKRSDIIGLHGGHAKVGAVGAIGIINEVKYDRKLKNAIIKELRKMGYTSVDCTVAVAKTAMGCLFKIAKKSEKKNTTINFSVHLNSGGGNGVEIYLPENASDKMIDKAYKFCKSLSKEFGFDNRGVRGIGKWYVNRHMRKCYLLEIGFVDSKKDVAIYNQYGPDVIGKRIAHLIVRYF